MEIDKGSRKESGGVWDGESDELEKEKGSCQLYIVQDGQGKHASMAEDPRSGSKG